jgi:hypothetical protein
MLASPQLRGGVRAFKAAAAAWCRWPTHALLCIKTVVPARFDWRDCMLLSLLLHPAASGDVINDDQSVINALVGVMWGGGATPCNISSPECPDEARAVATELQR